MLSEIEFDNICGDGHNETYPPVSFKILTSLNLRYFCDFKKLIPWFSLASPYISCVNFVMISWQAVCDDWNLAWDCEKFGETDYIFCSCVVPLSHRYVVFFPFLSDFCQFHFPCVTEIVQFLFFLSGDRQKGATKPSQLHPQISELLIPTCSNISPAHIGQQRKKADFLVSHRMLDPWLNFSRELCAWELHSEVPKQAWDLLISS